MPEQSEDFASPEWQAEWDRWLRKIASYERPQDVRRARMFALITTFGNFEQYHTDLAFYAKVENCAYLLDAIEEAMQSGRKGDGRG